MCGIVGYVGKRSAQDVLLDGLEKLEYRGYDSAGVALALDGGIRVVKSKGRLTALREKLAAQQLAQSFCGIGHTRWATHGEPSDVNSHPHSTPRVSIVHNGIIENYGLLKERLAAKGYTFQSETDTEVLVKLIDSCYTGDPLRALQQALAKVRGSYALAGHHFCSQAGKPADRRLGRGRKLCGFGYSGTAQVYPEIQRAGRRGYGRLHHRGHPLLQRIW